MNKRTRRVFAAVLLGLLLCLGVVPAFAAEDGIPLICVDVLLHGDGSASITETWTVRGVSSGTEYYKGIRTDGRLVVHSLQVSDEAGVFYAEMESWDTKRSREEKAGTCGILKTKKGYELCWGIGNYGDHTYTIRYTLEGLVQDYGDYAGFYHRFVGELSSAPEEVALQIRLEDASLGEEHARIWAYGFAGDVGHANGALFARSSEALGKNGYVNLLCRFERGLFPGAAVAEQSFAELQKQAEDDDSDAALWIVLGGCAALMAAALGTAVFYEGRYRLADGSTVRRPAQREIPENMNVPLDGSIPAVCAALELLRRPIGREHKISAYLIAWQGKGYIQIQGQEEENEEIIFDSQAGPKDGSEAMLFHSLHRFAQGGRLSVQAIEEHAEKLDAMLEKWEDALDREGMAALERAGLVASGAKGKECFTQAGFEQAMQLLGFQKYLQYMGKREGGTVGGHELWESYLVFAALFGVGQRVLKGLEAADPARFEGLSRHYGCSSFSTMLHFILWTNHISSASTSSSSSSSTSMHGGGGFSGGGGGGSR